MTSKQIDKLIGKQITVSFNNNSMPYVLTVLSRDKRTFKATYGPQGKTGVFETVYTKLITS